jgi:hypothetical protein
MISVNSVWILGVFGCSMIGYFNTLVLVLTSDVKRDAKRDGLVYYNYISFIYNLWCSVNITRLIADNANIVNP